MNSKADFQPSEITATENMTQFVSRLKRLLTPSEMFPGEVAQTLLFGTRP